MVKQAPICAGRFDERAFLDSRGDRIQQTIRRPAEGILWGRSLQDRRGDAAVLLPSSGSGPSILVQALGRLTHPAEEHESGPFDVFSQGLAGQLWVRRLDCLADFEV